MPKYVVESYLAHSPVRQSRHFILVAVSSDVVSVSRAEMEA